MNAFLLNNTYDDKLNGLKREGAFFFFSMKINILKFLVEK